MNDDKINITIRIAGQKPLALLIPRSQEEQVRHAEFQVNRLWSSWTQRYPDKNAVEVLAMVAYRFAELFFTTNRTVEESASVLEAFDRDLDEMIHGMERAAAGGA